MTRVKVGDVTVEWDRNRIRGIDGTLDLNFGDEVVVERVEALPPDLIVLLLRGVDTQATSNVVAVDARTGTQRWQVKDRPGAFDDELVGFEIANGLVRAWSWNFVYVVDPNTGSVTEVQPNR